MSDRQDLHESRFAEAQEIYERLSGKRFEPTLQPGEPENKVDMWKMHFEHCFTDIWSRPGLDWRTRDFVTIAILTTLGAESHLAAHIRTALHIGITREEIVELFIHSSGYCGVPRAQAAFTVASDVFRELDARTEQSGT
jgi:4-carboxymuconolactone decarboxylase